MKKLQIVLFLLAAITSTALAGGPWPQKKGSGYFKLSEWWTVFDQHYTDAGLLDPNTTTGIYNTFLYAEYGLSNRVTGIFNGAIFGRNYMNNLVSATTNDVIVPGEAINGIGDIDLGLKYGLTKPGARIPVAASLILGIPSGKTGGGTQGNLQTGDGEFNQMLQIDAGTGFRLGSKTTAYVSAFTAVNNRTKGFSEEFRFGLEAGVGLFGQKLWLTGRFNSIESFKNGDTAANVNSTSIFCQQH